MTQNETSERKPEVIHSEVAIAKKPKMGVGLSRERRQELMEKIIDPKVTQELEAAYETFFGALASPDLSPVERMALTAYGVTSLGKALDGEVLETIIMPLMNTPAGFVTDKDPSKHESWMNKPPATPYPKDIVLKCSVQAILHGLPLTGGCFSIIAGGMYPRKEGYEYLVGSVAKYSATMNVPPIGKDLFEQGGYLKVPVVIKYRLHTEPEEIAGEDGRMKANYQTFTASYSVRLNRKNAVGVEACEGKAKRKALRDLWAAITGTLLGDADDTDQKGEVHQVGAHFGAPETGSKTGALVASLSPEPATITSQQSRALDSALKKKNWSLHDLLVALDMDKSTDLMGFPSDAFSTAMELLK